MPSDLERIAQGLIEYLDANPRIAAEFGGAAAQCQELAAQVAELAVLLPEAAAAASVPSGCCECLRRSCSAGRWRGCCRASVGCRCGRCSIRLA